VSSIRSARPSKGPGPYSSILSTCANGSSSASPPGWRTSEEGREAEAAAGQFSHGIDQAQDFVTGNLHWIVPIVVLAFVLIVVITLVVVWLSSRARFTFLYDVARNKAEFWNPWRQFRDHGNSLFGFRIVLTIVGFIMVAGFLAPIGVLVFLWKTGGAPGLLAIWGLGVCAVLFFCAVVVLRLVGLFTQEFVVPIMYARTASWVEGWRILLDLMAFNKARFILYALFQFVIWLITVALLVAAMCFTCGCACCFLALPYIGTVVILPILVFLRAYSLYYLEQYGAEDGLFGLGCPVFGAGAVVSGDGVLELPPRLRGERDGELDRIHVHPLEVVDLAGSFERPVLRIEVAADLDLDGDVARVADLDPKTADLVPAGDVTGQVEAVVARLKLH
jgi:hypothetical protein